MPPSIFSFKHYKPYIVAYVKALGEPWGYWAQLAKAMGCQPAALSRCLKDKNHLTVDQVLALSRFWSLSSLESEYLLSLLDSERALHQETRNYFLQKLEQIRLENENLTNRFKKESFAKSEDVALYYSNWIYMAIHFATSVPKLQTVTSLSQRFHISKSQTQSILERLQAMGLVSRKGDHWLFEGGEFHLSKTSPLVSTHHQNWRSRATLDSQNLNHDGLHYTAVYTMSEADFTVLKQKFLKWIDTSREIVSKSNEEEVITFNLDFFRS